MAQPLKIFILVTHEFPPLPEAIQKLQDFGHEQVTWQQDGRSHYVCGTSVLIMAEKEEIAKWLNGKKAWVTTNPMIGDWHQIALEVQPTVVS